MQRSTIVVLHIIILFELDDERNQNTIEFSTSRVSALLRGLTAALNIQRPHLRPSVGGQRSLHVAQTHQSANEKNEIENCGEGMETWETFNTAKVSGNNAKYPRELPATAVAAQ
jgi:hypothetical protein